VTVLDIVVETGVLAHARAISPRDPAVLAAEPLTELLYDRTASGGQPVHQIDPAAVPTDGLRLDRRYVLGRRCDGTPVLWIQRRRSQLDASPDGPPSFNGERVRPPRGAFCSGCGVVSRDTPQIHAWRSPPWMA
jgi:hypothetical protein